MVHYQGGDFFFLSNFSFAVKGILNGASQCAFEQVDILLPVS